MINHINTSMMQGLQAKDAQKKWQGEKARTSAEPDATLQVRYGALIDKAVNSSEGTLDDIQEARELLASGEIDSRENIRQAAQNLIDHGV